MQDLKIPNWMFAVGQGIRVCLVDGVCNSVRG